MLGAAPIRPLVRKAVTLSFCQTARSSRTMRAILVENMRSACGARETFARQRRSVTAWLSLASQGWKVWPSRLPLAPMIDDRLAEAACLERLCRVPSADRLEFAPES